MCEFVQSKSNYKILILFDIFSYCVSLVFYNHGTLSNWFYRVGEIMDLQSEKYCSFNSLI